ncbi:MAG: xanthine dehydrogenase family protein molybdopterin-binding subunit [Ignavibacteriales bacterium]|nr:xanthine dehydrogenase family protein molybdopterin-binding subunit [Ignavibacteriales bacterium]
MSTSTLSRRTFIKVASAAGGGLVLSFYLPGKESMFAGTSKDEAFAPNAWLRISGDGAITITVARSEMGQGVWTSLPMIVAEELEADWNAVSIYQADAHPSLYGSQSTGGSFSVRGSWMNLRNAGATAREMLISAAAQKWNVARTACKAKNGFVHHSTGKKLSYGELSAIAATLPIPHSVKLKDESAFSLLGKRIPKLDTPDKVYGKAVFGMDVRVPGMVFASIEKCPVFGGKVVSFDGTKTKALPGVVDVVQVDDGIAVVATSTWAAFRGREELSVSWDEGKWANQSSRDIRELFRESVKSKGNTENYAGDVDSAFTNAVTTLEAVYEAPFVAHQTMEPMNCIADVRPDRCEIWAPTQNPQAGQNEASRILGLPIDRVMVHVTLLGGGFGRRLNSDFIADAVKVSKAIGKPVSVVWTREDDTQHDWYRPMTYNVLRGGLDKNGVPVAWHHRVAGPSSRGLVVGGSTPPYAIPNFLVDSHIKDTGVPIGAWRSVGPSQNGWIVESFIDELAHTAGKDPLEFRRGLLTKSPRLKRTLEFAAEKAEWNKSLPKGVGRGIACVESFGSTCAQVAEVSVDRDGSLTIHRIVVAVDCGPVVNPDTIEAQIEGGIAFALSALLKDEITIEKGRVQQGSYDDYRMIRFDEMPKVEVHLVQSSEPIGGIGEPSVPPVAPAVCNAIFAATGIRIWRLPIRQGDLKKT